MKAKSDAPVRTAVAMAIALLAGSPAVAVNLSPKGTGQVLLFPYYTTRPTADAGAQSTLISVINTTNLAKAVVVHFHEGKNGKAVLNLNVFLSPFDSWNVAVVEDSSTGGARMITQDKSCTLPPLSASPTGSYMSFSNDAYSGPGDDKAGTSLDRTKEGFFEIIEMATFASNSTTGIAITHVSGAPPCGINEAQPAADALALTGGLMGSAEIIGLNRDASIVTEPVVLDNFYNVGPNYQFSGFVLPDLTQAAPPFSAVLASNGNVYRSTWSFGSPDAVSAVLMYNNVLNQYASDPATGQGTDWIVTMPTKRYYTGIGPGNAPRLFQRNFNGAAGSCDTITLNIYDREEAAQVPTPSSPCWVANVMTTNNANVLGSTNAVNQPLSLTGGWLRIGFPTGVGGADANVHRLINVGATSITTSAGVTTTGNTVTYTGLPVIGFAVILSSVVQNVPTHDPKDPNPNGVAAVITKPIGVVNHGYTRQIN